MADVQKAGVRFSPTIELGHLIQAAIMAGTMLSWGLVGYYQVSRTLDQHAAEMALFKQRLTADEVATSELRESTKASVTALIESAKVSSAETRQQLSKISDQVADLRTLVAGQARGADGPRR